MPQMQKFEPNDEGFNFVGAQYAPNSYWEDRGIVFFFDSMGLSWTITVQEFERRHIAWRFPVGHLTHILNPPVMH